MSQTIDLRKKQSAPKPFLVPKLPEVIPALSVSEEKEVFDLESEPETTQDANAISWTTMMTHVPSKESAWYIVIILFLGAGAVAYFRQDMLFSIILVLVGIVVALRTYSKPHSSPIHLDRTGIAIDDQKYLYHEVGSFWLDYQPPHTKELSLQFKKVRHAPMRIPLESANPLEIRALMIQFIPEKEHERSTFDHVVRLLGF